MLCWRDIVDMLWEISGGIENIHENTNEIYGVLPYVAPEILKGNPPTKASDIFSFGIIMWTLSAGVRPWRNIPHDLRLASEICFGLQPEIVD
ncbi:kinase-like domain-containing protein [Rhizophagus clarus]|uniref:Kinase-like domain-containing protein n=1 Tax=Rhizophagus clarus TaxID=94130 RepID=A0A8H3M7P4_9GLOM|nr:kinase-like domain-containing protein [Rhizophagus clarus]